MARAHYLLWLALATIRRAPESPLVAGADGVERIPKLSRDAGIRWIFQHADALAVLDLPADLAAELKVVTLVVDRPGAISLHQNAVIGGGDQLLEAQRLLPGSRLMLVMRIIGRRFQPSARRVPPERFSPMV